jgi:hypothetical protein
MEFAVYPAILVSPHGALEALNSDPMFAVGRPGAEGFEFAGASAPWGQIGQRDQLLVRHQSFLESGVRCASANPSAKNFAARNHA